VHGHVVTAVALLRSRLPEPWTRDVLAGEVHLSASQFGRAFDATVGHEPNVCLRIADAEFMPVLERRRNEVINLALVDRWDVIPTGPRCSDPLATPRGATQTSNRTFREKVSGEASRKCHVTRLKPSHTFCMAT
jgi:hypothetical protein